MLLRINRRHTARLSAMGWRLADAYSWHVAHGAKVPAASV
jgi:hypothetical protein